MLFNKNIELDLGETDSTCSDQSYLDMFLGGYSSEEMEMEAPLPGPIPMRKTKNVI